MGSIARVVSLDPVVTGLSVERTPSRALCGTGAAWFVGSHRRQSVARRYDQPTLYGWAPLDAETEAGVEWASGRGPAPPLTALGSRNTGVTRMNPAKMRDKMARKLVKHELDVDAYLADGGTLMDLGIIDSFGNIPPDDIKWKRVRRIISFFQRVQRHFYDKSGRPVGKRPTDEQLRAIWNEPETPIDPTFLDSVPQSYTTMMVLPKQTAH